MRNEFIFVSAPSFPVLRKPLPYTCGYAKFLSEERIKNIAPTSLRPATITMPILGNPLCYRCRPPIIIPARHMPCFHHILMPAAILYHVRMLPTYDLEATGKMREKARIKQSETFSLWEKPNSPGAQEQAPRGNQTQVEKACMTAAAQLLP